jgi:hypothetical protein
MKVMLQPMAYIETTIPSFYHNVRTSSREPSMPEKPLSDPVIDEIRAVRSRISAQFNHDPDKLVEYYMELQKRHANRLVGNVKDFAPKDEAAS